MWLPFSYICLATKLPIVTCSFLQQGHGEQTFALQGIPFPGLSDGTCEEVAFVQIIPKTVQKYHVTPNMIVTQAQFYLTAFISASSLRSRLGLSCLM